MTASRLALMVVLTIGLPAAPLAADAQQAGKLARIGFLAPTSESAARQLVDSFRRGLQEAGYAEGQNMQIEYRWSEGRDDRFLALVADLVSQNVVRAGDQHENRQGARPHDPASVLVRADEIIHQ
jgi:putative ABC transport system substrate-binding protein